MKQILIVDDDTGVVSLVALRSVVTELIGPPQ
jgi:hypothetical protein